MVKTRAKLYPFLFEHVDVPRIWGGTKLGSAVEGIPIGERWLLSPLQGKETLVKNGVLAGEKLSTLAKLYGNDLLGEKGTWDNVPLIKWIDTELSLSIQVHPNNLFAQQHGEKHGKTEMWYILSAAPEAEIYLGTPEGFSREDLKTAVEEHTLEKTLRVYHPAPGEVYAVPGGVLHSLGGGMQLLEIQQASDTTYRLYDWERVDANGKRRPLQLDWAYKAYDPLARPTIFTPQELQEKQVYLHQAPLSLACYKTQRLDCKENSSENTAHIYLALQPTRLEWKDDTGRCQSMDLPAMSPLFIPVAIQDYSLISKDLKTPITLLVCKVL